jgi:hypothetical protein
MGNSLCSQPALLMSAFGGILNTELMGEAQETTLNSVSKDVLTTTA